MNLLPILWLLAFTATIHSLSAQERLDAPFSPDKMSEDLQLFRRIRDAANSGVYKYRSHPEIDSLYRWAESEVARSETYLDFYNIIAKITDFEGSAHNNTDFSDEVFASMKAEPSGYFPYPIKLISGGAVINVANDELPLGSKVVSINGEPMADVLPKLYKYYTTDGFNISGKVFGINKHFSRYYRLHYGRQDRFEVAYTLPHGDELHTKEVESVSYAQYYDHFKNRHSAPLDSLSYEFSVKQILAGQGVYDFSVRNDETAVLTVNSFLIGWNKKDKRHKKYVAFLDSCFTLLADSNINHLIVDVRHNGGGTDPNDMITYSYLTSEPFVENTAAWVSADKVPYWKHFDYDGFFLLKPIAKVVYNRMLKKAFSIEKDGRFYLGEDEDNTPRMPNEKTFDGQVYLLISPGVASAGSMFAAMVAGNTNAIVIGEETMGGYYGHNGHVPVSYVLPNSGIETTFSIVNLDQDVPPKDNQPPGSGVRPDYEVPQSRKDFLNNEDTPMKFTLDLIARELNR